MKTGGQVPMLSGRTMQGLMPFSRGQWAGQDQVLGATGGDELKLVDDVKLEEVPKPEEPECEPKPDVESVVKQDETTN